MALVKFSDVEKKTFLIRGEKVILDGDVAVLYSVKTREVNQAVKNNPDKFPRGYIIELKRSEFYDLRSKFMTAHAEKTRTLPKAFTEKGLYMLATILKSPQATQVAIAIVEAFDRIRELSRTVAELSQSSEEFSQKTLMHRGGDIMAEILGDDLKMTDSETSLELNFAMFNVKHTFRRQMEPSGTVS